MLDFGMLVIWLVFSYDVKISPTKWENYVGYLRPFAQNLRHPLLTTESKGRSKRRYLYNIGASYLVGWEMLGRPAQALLFHKPFRGTWIFPFGIPFRRITLYVGVS